MFAAAMIFSAAGVECSIYSTCKRISQKLLRNVAQFLEIIYDGLGVSKYKVIRQNMEEIVLQGPEGEQDRRIVNSYPSKVIYMSIFFFSCFVSLSMSSTHRCNLVNTVSIATY